MAHGVVTNPLWLRAALYVAVFAFPALTVFLLWIAMNTFSEVGLIGGGAVFILAAAIAHISYAGFTFFPFIGAVLHYSDSGFVIEKRGRTTSFNWSDIGPIEQRDYTQLLVIRDSQSKTLYVVDYATPGFDPFSETLKRKVRHDQTAA